MVPIPWIAATACRVASWICPTWPEIASVALPVWLASAFTSEATTAKPLPASPARAASIVAFKASKFVCPAMSWMSSTTSPIFWALTARLCTTSSVRFAS